MDEFKVAHLPVLNGTKLVGIITEADILDMNTPELAIEEYKLSLIRPHILDSQHIYDVMRLIATMPLTLVPVIDAEENYLGVISLKILLQNIRICNC